MISFPYVLKLNNNVDPAVIKIKNNNISNKSFSIDMAPPIKDRGMDPTKYGSKVLRFKFPALI